LKENGCAGTAQFAKTGQLLSQSSGSKASSPSLG
jgi:hypothetical protein